MPSKETIKIIKEMRNLYKKLIEIQKEIITKLKLGNLKNSEHMKLEYELEQNKETMENIRKYFAKIQYIEEINKRMKEN
ncbi:hypothetical protein EV215_1770 [Hypnocyclicus thermotrophus]|uniref:Uncharacterized protein n=1 Tax=Hypnocyclicus thermotrophus TaxID=1627895 RepID=A0AA46DXW4_9FUSO|nr:hypothetical protein [Hypnocyclicus thermotrophus]TDT68049.1 hypothetical protein EV215_1770 [Hypnocyclicus thermotrophus]